jgi:hypothetical protein
VNEKNQFIAQVCHIEAAEERGERFNPNQSDEERRSYGNLILLCYPHHIETDDVDLYPKERLQAIKAQHEEAFGQKLFQIDESLLYKISSEMAAYWQYIDHLHKEHHVASDIAIEIKSDATYSELTDQVAKLVEDLSHVQEYLIESDRLRAEPNRKANAAGPNDFEVLYIGFTNVIARLSVALVQMDIKFLEEFLKLHPDDTAARQRLERCKSKFAEYATSAGYAD